MSYILFMSKEDVYMHDYLEFKKLKFWKEKGKRKNGRIF